MTTVITIIFVIASFSVFFMGGGKLRKGENVEHYPALISSTGVIGTFAGIVAGLFFFNVSDISNSITDLLGGLKTAFITSIVGMVLSFAFTMWMKISAQSVPNDTEKLLQRIYTSLQSLSSSISRNGTSTQNLISSLDSDLKALTNSFQSFERDFSSYSSSNTSSLSQFMGLMLTIDTNVEAIKNSLSSLTSMQDKIKSDVASMRPGLDMLITNVANGNKEMVTAFDKFSKELQKNNVEALVDVMKKVTEEFNKQMSDLINKLVQENFEQLNHSVEQLNQWQIENKEMINALIVQYGEMETSFRDTDDTLSNVAESTQSLVQSGGKLDNLIQELQKVIIDDSYFARLTNDLNNSISAITEATTEYGENTRKLNKWFTSTKDLTLGVEKVLNELEKLDIEDTLDSISEEYYNQLSATLSNLDDCITAVLNKQSSGSTRTTTTSSVGGNLRIRRSNTNQQ